MIRTSPSATTELLHGSADEVGPVEDLELRGGQRQPRLAQRQPARRLEDRLGDAVRFGDQLPRDPVPAPATRPSRHSRRSSPLTRPRRNESSTAHTAFNLGTTSARSTSVRAGVVNGTPLRTSTSPMANERAWQVNSRRLTRRCPCGTVTCSGPRTSGIGIPCTRAAVWWLATASGTLCSAWSRSTRPVVLHDCGDPFVHAISVTGPRSSAEVPVTRLWITPAVCSS